MLPKFMLALITVCTIPASIIGMNSGSVKHNAPLNTVFIELPTYMTPTARLFDSIAKNDVPSFQQVLEQNQISQDDIAGLVCESITQAHPEITSILMKNKNFMITKTILTTALTSNDPRPFIEIIQNAPDYQAVYNHLVAEYILLLLEMLNAPGKKEQQN